MSLLFNPENKVIVVTAPAGKNYEPAVISVPSIETDCGDNSVFILGSSLNYRVPSSIQETLGNELYVYTRGRRLAPMKIQGIAYHSTGDNSGANLLIDWFENRGAFISNSAARTITINYKNNTITGLLLDLKIQHSKISVPLFRFEATIFPTAIS